MRKRFRNEVSVKNKLDSLFFTRLFVSERKQIALMADEKPPARISHRLLTTSRSEMRVIMRKKRHRLFILFVFIAAASAAIITYKSSTAAQNRLQEDLASRIIRFHVRANSDSERDQQLKLKVKDSVVKYLAPLLEDSESIEESKQILSQSVDEIKRLAEETLRAEGADNSVSVYFEESYFPMKSYADVTFPPGVYEAFRIDIGDSMGKNWWCVLYPPLCFVDSSCGVLPDESKEKLKNILTEDEYNAVTDTQYIYRFKVLTFLNDWLFGGK